MDVIRIIRSPSTNLTVNLHMTAIFELSFHLALVLLQNVHCGLSYWGVLELVVNILLVFRRP